MLPAVLRRISRVQDTAAGIISRGALFGPAINQSTTAFGKKAMQKMARRGNRLYVPTCKKGQKPAELCLAMKGIFNPFRVFTPICATVELKDEHNSIHELARDLDIRTVDVLKAMFRCGLEPNSVEDYLNYETAEQVCDSLGVKVVPLGFTRCNFPQPREPESPEVYASLPLRPPVTTIMGHVDHGKTTLLDTLRKTNVAAGEAGFITQSIGAFTVNTRNPGKDTPRFITYLDTPGHAAFHRMRRLGGQVTDIVVLVVSLDDGVQDQTEEVIELVNFMNLPMVVALNKCDKEGADPRKVRRQLAERGIVDEVQGGSHLFVEISGKTGKNLDKLEEAILYTSELLDLRADPNGPAEGIVLESTSTKDGGFLSTFIIKKGTLKLGQTIFAGALHGKVKAMSNQHVANLKEAGPSMPVQIYGLKGIPEPGSRMFVAENETHAETCAGWWKGQDEKRRLQATSTSYWNSMTQLDVSTKVLPYVIKADNQGSLSAIKDVIDLLPAKEVFIRVAKADVGMVSESDLQMAHIAKANVLAFNVKVDQKALRNYPDIECKHFNVLYHLVDELTRSISKNMAPVETSRVVASADVQQVFVVNKGKKSESVVGGLRVTLGTFKRTMKARVMRPGPNGLTAVWTGDIADMKCFKEKVSEVKKGSECGIQLEGFNDFVVGDVVQCVETDMVAPVVSDPFARLRVEKELRLKKFGKGAAAVAPHPSMAQNHTRTQRA
eukprot:gnl/Spiro4/20788_TR10118_c0_g2_i1.p1 gnl/Spiro4/20788_TR10118_c0_g2~~gnl/Spiro4/20788_TR10118_c0_g2_i1.p1  ORF type:complete len:723 (-),score=163.78 gnl/Spiro4/20788_TR10118_c0_g2_i1:85-2253(-)